MADTNKSKKYIGNGRDTFEEYPTKPRLPNMKNPPIELKPIPAEDKDKILVETNSGKNSRGRRAAKSAEKAG